MRYHHPRYLFRRYEIMRRIKQGQHFLEVGPGNLGLAQDLLSRFRRGTLIDFNTADVKQIYNDLSKQYKQRLDLIIADFTKYDEFEIQYDCVIACDVLEHIEDDILFLRKTYSLIKEGGQLILSVPARQKYWSIDDEIVGHYRRYEKQELIEKLSETGFSQIAIASFGYPFQNLVRLGRIALTKFQYRERSQWDRKQQSQQSAFLVKRKPYLNLLGLVMNKYTLYPFSLFMSLFNGFDLGEGYVVSAAVVESAGQSNGGKNMVQDD